MMKRGMDKVSADIGLIFLTYNLRRLITLLGKELRGGHLSVIFELKWLHLALKRLLKPLKRIVEIHFEYLQKTAA